jgi:hypothetical protein
VPRPSRPTTPQLDPPQPLAPGHSALLPIDLLHQRLPLAPPCLRPPNSSTSIPHHAPPAHPSIASLATSPTPSAAKLPPSLARHRPPAPAPICSPAQKSPLDFPCSRTAPACRLLGHSRKTPHPPWFRFPPTAAARQAISTTSHT